MKAIFLLFCIFHVYTVTAQEVCVSLEEQLLYDLLMDYRKSKKLKVIPISSKLTKVAQAHVRDLAEHFDYENRGDCNPHSWSSSGSWSACCYTPDHKQAACMWSKPKEISGYQGDGYEIAFYSSDGAGAQESLDAWKQSAGHNPVVVNSGTWEQVTWNAIGVGIYNKYAVVWFGQVADPSTISLCR